MATVTGITADKALAILNQTVKSIKLSGANFVATRYDNTDVSIGSFTDAVQAAVDDSVDSAVAAAVPPAVAGSLINKGNLATGTVSFSGITVAQLNNSIIKATLTGNVTVASTSFPAGMPAGSQFVMVLTQDATGSRTLTLSGIKRSQGVLTLSTTAGAIDIVSFLYDGTNWYAGLMGLAFA